jgi:dolichol-phosphate mannosyltransferase
MKRVLVTGAGGFVGANLTRRLLRHGHAVHTIARRDNWRLREIANDIRNHEIDLADASSVASVVAAAKPEWVFHLAAYGAYSSQTDWRRMIASNLLGTGNLVDACLQVGFDALVNTGSSSEYGYKNHAPSESEMLDPNSYYAVTKASATMYCRHTAQNRNVHIPTLRLYSVYGPFEEPDRLIPTLIFHGLRGRFPPLVDPDVARDFIYIDDVCDAYILSAERRTNELGAVYNVGTGVQTSLREAVATARRLFQIDDEPQWGSMPNRRWDTSVWVADHKKITEQLGWQPRVAFEAGLRAMVDWLGTNPDAARMYANTRDTSGNA